MKKSIILSGIVAIFALTSCEKDQPSNLFSEEERQEQADLVVDPENAAVLTFEEDVYDFGSLPAAAKVDHYVKFTNTGKSPLIIRDAKGSCGCTVPVWPKEPIAPGATDSMKITYEAGNQKGKQRKIVTLHTNTVKDKEVWTFTADLPTDTQNNNANALSGL